jgi:SOR/SNZ family
MNDNLIRLKTGLAEMLKGGVIMDVTNADQARESQRTREPSRLWHSSAFLPTFEQKAA